MSLVIDSSLTLAWLFADERTKATDLLFHAVLNDGAIVPSLWRLEIANALEMAVRRKRVDADFRDASLRDLALLPIAVDPETDSQAWGATLGIAARYGLTLYDAAYLELAQRQRLPLGSLDRDLRKACRAMSVPVKPA